MASKKNGKKLGQSDTKSNGRSQGKKNSNGSNRSNRSGIYITEEDPEEEMMSPIRQATLVNYHMAIEDSVDIDKIWDTMQEVFDENQQRDVEDEPTKKEQMKKMLDLLPMKNDRAFDQLVKALRPDYKWLALRLQEGVKDEEKRIGKLGKGIKRKIALALLTARISDRQKDGIMDRVTSVVEAEMTHKAMRVNIPDHRAAAQLERVHRSIQQLIREEVDPLLYGEGHESTWATEDYDETMDVLKNKLEELQIFNECYHAVSIAETNSNNLPSLLLQKIEEIKTRIKILEREKQEATIESARLSQERDEQHRSISKLEQYNRSLELENRTLEDDKQYLEQTVKKLQSTKRLTEKDYQKLDNENRDLKSELQQQQDRLSDVSLRIKSLDDQNTKLIRDNQKLSTANSELRKNARSKGNNSAAAVKSENKRLTNDRTKLKKEIQKLEGDKRQLVITSQKLEAQNRNLKEQKRKLLSDKRRFQDENRFLRDDAKRLAIGKYTILPPIDEDAYSEDYESTGTGRSRGGRLSRSRSLRDSYPRDQPATRKIARTEEKSPEKPKAKSDTPWNKYTSKDEDKKISTGSKDSKDKNSSSKDKADTNKGKEGTSKDKAGTSRDTTGTSKDKAGISKDSKDKDKAGTSKDSKDKAGTSKENKDKDKVGTSKDSKDKDKAGTSKDNKDKDKAGTRKDSNDKNKDGKTGGVSDDPETAKQPAYMLPTAASRRRNDDEPSPRRAAAWK